LEPEDGEENMAVSIRNAHAIMEGRRLAENEDAYANRQLTVMITSLDNIIDRWGNHDLEGVAEKIERVKALLTDIQQRLEEEE
jgi:hypothetical protein